MQVGLGLFDDQTAIAGLRILGKFAENHGHEDEVVEAQTVLLNLQLVDQQGQARRQPLEITGTQPDFERLGQLFAQHGAVAAGDGGLRVNDRWMQLQIGIELLECRVDALTPCVVGQQLKQAGELAGAAWLQAERCIAQRGQVHPAQVLHHVRRQPDIVVVAAPALDPQATDLVSFAVANADEGVELAIGAELQRRKEIGLVVQRQVTKNVLECNRAVRRAAVLRKMNVFGTQAGVRFVMAGEQRSQGIDDSRLADVVGADEHIQTRLKVQDYVPKPAEVRDSEPGEVHHCILAQSAAVSVCFGALQPELATPASGRRRSDPFAIRMPISRH